MINDDNKHNLSRKSIILSITVVILLLLTNITIGDKNLDIQGNKYVQDTDFDDCESTEVLVDKIVSPPSRGMTGTYDIIARFSSVEIIMNGINDIDENEPWIKHEESPDDNNTPFIEFYTSCDEDFMYIAFENETGRCILVEIFIDKNMRSLSISPIQLVSQSPALPPCAHQPLQ